MMATVKKNERFIPLKNYVIVFLIVVGAIALVWYAFSWHKVIKEDRLSTSYLVKTKAVSNEIQGLERLNDVLSEVPSTYFLYISYTGTDEIYKMEKGLANIINDYKLGEQVYFLNVTSIKDDKELLAEVTKSLNLEENVLKQIPTIIYYNDGKVVDIITRDDNKIMDIGDFQKLLDRNKIEKGQ